MGGKKSLFNSLGNLQKWVFRFKGFKTYANPVGNFPMPGWYDTHASK